MFSGDSDGYLIQWNVNPQIKSHLYDKVHEKGVYSLLITKNDKFLFSLGKFGELKQFDIINKTMVNNYGRLFGADQAIMMTTEDSKYLFIASMKHGEFKQIL